MATSFLTRMLQGGGLSVVKLATGFIKVKLLSTLLGVAGMGALSLAVQFQLVAGLFVSLLLSSGFLNQGRPLLARGDDAEAAGVLGTALGLVLANAVIFLVAFFMFRDEVARFLILPQSIAPWIIWSIALAAVLTAISMSICEALIMAFNRYDQFVRANIFAAICDLCVFGAAAWRFGVAGAIAAILASAACQLLLYILRLGSIDASWRLLRQLRFDLRRVRPLLSFSAYVFVGSAVYYAATLVARAHIAGVAGVHVNGLMQAPIAFAAYLQPFVLNGVSGYLQPLAAEHGDGPVARTELNRVLRTNMRLIVAGCVGMAAAGPIAIPLAYTGDFLAASPYVSIYFIGEIFYMHWVILGWYLLAIGDKRPYVAGWLAYSMALVAIVYLFGSTLGAWAYVLGHVLASFATACGALCYGFAKGQVDAGVCRALCLWGGVAALACGLIYFASALTLGAWGARGLGACVVLVAMAPFFQRAWTMGMARLGRFAA